MLTKLSGPPKPLAKCRNCDNLPRLAGALYCALCLDDVISLSRMSLRQRHPTQCFCVDCMCPEQRNFRKVQAAAREVQKLYLNLPPDDSPNGPRVA